VEGRLKEGERRKNLAEGNCTLQTGSLENKEELFFFGERKEGTAAKGERLLNKVQKRGEECCKLHF